MSLDLSKPQSSNTFLKELYKKFFGIPGESPLQVQQTDAAGVAITPLAAATFTSGAQKTQVVDANGLEKTGVCNGTDAAATSNTVDLPKPGYFEVRGTAGNVKFDPVVGTAGQTLAFDSKELSKFRVKRIYATGTTATSIVIYY